MYAEKVAAPHAMTPTAIQCRGSSPPPPTPPHPTLHTNQKFASMVWSPTDNFIFTFLNLPPGAISQVLARSILRQLWLDSIAKWSVILHFFVLNKNNYPLGLLSIFYYFLWELYCTWDQQIQCTYMYNKIWDFRGGECPLPHLFTHMGMGGACALGSLYAHEMQTWSRAK